MITSQSANQHRRLQSVMNAATKLIHRRRRYDHVTPLLRDLHWLKAPERGDFNLAVTVYKCLHGLAPQCLADSIQRVSGSGSRQLRSSWTDALVVPYTRLVTAGDRAFSSFGSRFGIVFPMMLPLLRHCQLSVLILRLICLNVLFHFDMYSAPAVHCGLGPL